MIKLTINQKGGLEAVQQLVSPAVYLDHWALRKISEDQTLATRFATAMKARNGTLVLSWLNLIEFTGVTVEQQARLAEEFLEANLPRVFFLEPDPFVVISREDALLKGGPLAPPHDDPELLKAFVCMKPLSPKPFTARDLFVVVQNGRLLDRFHSFANTVVERIEALRTELDTDPTFTAAIRCLPAGPPIQRGTRFILQELVRALLVDKGTKVTRNHAIDLLHAVVSVSYCDYVLLDKHWEEQISRVRSRFGKAGLSVPTANVFSGKAGEVERFLCELESTRCCSAATG